MEDEDKVVDPALRDAVIKDLADLAGYLTTAQKELGKVKDPGDFAHEAGKKLAVLSTLLGNAQGSCYRLGDRLRACEAVELTLPAGIAICSR